MQWWMSNTRAGERARVARRGRRSISSSRPRRQSPRKWETIASASCAAAEIVRVATLQREVACPLRERLGAVEVAALPRLVRAQADEARPLGRIRRELLRGLQVRLGLLGVVLHQQRLRGPAMQACRDVRRIRGIERERERLHGAASCRRRRRAARRPAPTARRSTPARRPVRHVPPRTAAAPAGSARYRAPSPSISRSCSYRRERLAAAAGERMQADQQHVASSRSGSTATSRLAARIAASISPRASSSPASSSSMAVRSDWSSSAVRDRPLLVAVIRQQTAADRARAPPRSTRRIAGSTRMRDVAARHASTSTQSPRAASESNSPTDTIRALRPAPGRARAARSARPCAGWRPPRPVRASARARPSPARGAADDPAPARAT